MQLCGLVPSTCTAEAADCYLTINRHISSAVLRRACTSVLVAGCVCARHDPGAHNTEGAGNGVDRRQAAAESRQKWRGPLGGRAAGGFEACRDWGAVQSRAGAVSISYSVFRRM